jgi:hypothetical protein
MATPHTRALQSYGAVDLAIDGSAASLVGISEAQTASSGLRLVCSLPQADQAN